mmetsp:Transcript_81967/g.171536  ORF Transcript_81967/g.171536 Transcript_81967/m.171536 type:complete len:1395 (-) Transcript_81967:280-4464(-)
MGIPRFYRWLSERYPFINENLTCEQLPEFDNLYLDMNGIIHNCSHNNSGTLTVSDEAEVFLQAFKYITRLFYLIRPKKMLYMAVDGCAPRAKMNQQRSRRFRAANDARELREEAIANGEEVGPSFDSNCITPGTEFMAKLTETLRFFICTKMKDDPLWQDVTIVLSGPDVPGEGEHKIMDYIRTAKAQPDYDPNQRHCLYGLDADLIMLALASHEPHFALLREEVLFGKQQVEEPERRLVSAKPRFQLLHISLLREYMAMEFDEKTGTYFDLERVVDDFVLFCALVGDDFLPPLPFAEIGEGGLIYLFQVYKDHLRNAKPGTEPWLTRDCGKINFPEFARFLDLYSQIEKQQIESCIGEGFWALGMRKTVGPEDAPEPANQLESPCEMVSDLYEATDQWYDVKFGIDIQTHQGTQEQKRVFHSYLEGLQWVMLYYFRGPNQASWSWYYPYYHAPFAKDLVELASVADTKVEFEVGEPFLPFQQLMAVLPSNSKALLPKTFGWLFDSAESPILDFYPQKFEIDIDGVKVPWGGVTLIPFIQQDRLLNAMQQALDLAGGDGLSGAELARNRFGEAYSYRYDKNKKLEAKSPMPSRYQSLQNCPVDEQVFRHPELPRGVEHFSNEVLPGFLPSSWGFPTLHVHPLDYSFEKGLKVFGMDSRSESVMIRLSPSSPLTPTEDSIMELLEAPYVRIDFPFAHWGRVTAVHTPHQTIYRAKGGKVQKVMRNARDHQWKVSELLKDLRLKRGLELTFDNEGRSRNRGKGWADDSDAYQYKLPLVVVQMAEASYINAEGVRKHRFSKEESTYLYHLVRIDKEPELQQRQPKERWAPAARAMCIDATGPYGQVGCVISPSVGGEVTASQFPRLSTKSWVTFGEKVASRVRHEHKQRKWYSMTEICTNLSLTEHVLSQVCGSVMCRGFDGPREDIGMNLMCKSKVGGEPLCLPCYTKFDSNREGWIFSDLAVEAIKDYRSKFPGIFQVARMRRAERGSWWRDMETADIFARDGADKIDYVAKSFLKYIKKQPWKNLPLAPSGYQALEAGTIQEIVDLLERTKQDDATGDNPSDVQGSKRLFSPLDEGERPPKIHMRCPEGGFELGQRGCYVKAYGLLPVGAKGTVIGVWNSGGSQELEILLDEDSFSATNRQGRTPAMRGVQVPAEAFMPLPASEEVRQWSAKLTAAKSEAPAAAFNTPSAAQIPIDRGTSAARTKESHYPNEGVSVEETMSARTDSSAQTAQQTSDAWAPKKKSSNKIKSWLHKDPLPENREAAAPAPAAAAAAPAAAAGAYTAYAPADTFGVTYKTSGVGKGPKSFVPSQKYEPEVKPKQTLYGTTKTGKSKGKGRDDRKGKRDDPGQENLLPAALPVEKKVGNNTNPQKPDWDAAFSNLLALGGKQSKARFQ